LRSTPWPAGSEPARRPGATIAIAAVLVALVAGLAVDLASGSGSSHRDPRAARVSVKGVAGVGSVAPAFEAGTLDGASVRLAESRGKPVVLNFWASWCAPCRKEFPLLRAALERHRDLAAIGVVFQDVESDARSFAREQRATWPLASDPDGSLAHAYGVRAIPQTFFITADGQIASRLFGFTSNDALERQLTKILPQRGPATPPS
jgi:cytochrome c biogenesis protein CcmG, thiol:disulfide interchange protein DsbE